MYMFIIQKLFLPQEHVQWNANFTKIFNTYANL